MNCSYNIKDLKKYLKTYIYYAIIYIYIYYT